ncbi:MAG: hypothetical protein Q8P11_03330 [bacterium]|nr:hypothetical protein [bacterium]
MKKFVFLFAVLLLMPFILVIPSRVEALEMSPIFFDLTAHPGDSFSQSINLTNDTSEVMTLNSHIGIIKTASADGTTSQLLPKPTDENTIADWITVTTPKVTLQPGEKKKVLYSLTVPLDATAGGHYAWISYTETPTLSSGSRVAVSSGIATQILLKVQGEVKESLSLQSFQTKTGIASFEKLPITFITHIFNEGTTHQRPSGIVEIKNFGGKTIATLPFNNDSEGGNILPKSGRSYETIWDRGFAFGKYSAVLDATYDGEQHLKGSVTIWVLPKALIIIWTLLLIIITMLIVKVVARMFDKTRTKPLKKKI